MAGGSHLSQPRAQREKIAKTTNCNRHNCVCVWGNLVRGKKKTGRGFQSSKQQVGELSAVDKDTQKELWSIGGGKNRGPKPNQNGGLGSKQVPFAKTEVVGTGQK